MSTTITRKKGKNIEIFTDDCPTCKQQIINVEIGKCAGCNLETFMINSDSEIVMKKLIEYNITIHPTTIIDKEIKVEGIPPFLWLCGDDFYKKLKNEYPL